jgi:GWxTD domain-containing protein
MFICMIKKRTVFFVLFSALLMGSFSACSSGPKIALDPGSKDFFQYARLIMSKQEKDIFNHLPDRESRQEFIAEFWEKRDPDPETEENEFKDQFYDRIEYANQRFKEGGLGANTDRGRIYIYFGFPDKIEESMMHRVPGIRGGILIWTFYRYEFAIRFVDQYGNNQYKFDPYDGVYGDIFPAMEKAMFGLVREGDELGRKFLDFQADYDRKNSLLTISLPPQSLSFKAEEEMLYADFDFTIFVYPRDGGSKFKHEASQTLKISEEDLVRQRDVSFRIPLEVPPGKYYLDIVIQGDKDNGKARKIFDIKS